jgi:hypothetical protein
MAVKGGPNIVTQGLVLDLDSGNKKSIPLDPTVNLVPNPNNPYLWGNGGGVAITASNVIAPDGTLTANTIYFNINGAYFAYTTGIGATTGSQYTTSYYIKMLTGSTFTAEWGGVHGGNRTKFAFNTNTGTFSNVSTVSGETYGAEQSTNGYWRIYYSSTLNAGTTPYYFPQLSIGASQSFAIWGVQIERNRYATPLVSGSRTTWTNIANLTQTASLVAASTTSSIPQFRSSSDGLLTFDGTGSSAAITSSWSYLSSSATEVIFSINTFSGSGVTSIGGYDLNSINTYSLGVAGLLYYGNNTRVVAASVITTTQVYRIVASTTVLNTGSYYHVVFNKDTTAGTLQLYVNGRLESTNTFDTGSYAQWPTTGSYVGSNNINIGTGLSSNLDWNPRHIPGKIPVFKIYNRTLTAQEVQQNYNAQKTRFNL